VLECPASRFIKPTVLTLREAIEHCPYALLTSTIFCFIGLCTALVELVQVIPSSWLPSQAASWTRSPLICCWPLTTLQS
jgi:hypothetical protein